MLAVEGIDKSFGTTIANRGVSLAIDRGEIVGLVGENGAGKSTLLSIMGGYLKPDAGQILTSGRPVSFGSPADAIRAGVGLVHQHLSLVPSFTVREQLELAGWREPGLPAIVSSLGPDAVINHLSLGERQRVEIAKAMVPRPGLLLLDEPTTILAPGEVQALFEHLRTLGAGGISIVIVTHKLHEVMDIAERIVVMAQGSVKGEFTREPDGAWRKDSSIRMLGLMFGLGSDLRPEQLQAAKTSVSEPGRILLELAGVSSAAHADHGRVESVDLALRQGVLHTVVGIDGGGQGELARIIAGFRPGTGSIVYLGSDISGAGSRERSDAGIRLLVDDRVGEGAIAGFSIAENLVIKRPRPRAVCSHGIMRWRRARDVARDVIADWDIQPADPDAPFGSLSGGNMQRVLAARELRANLRVLVALNPVQGLDVRTARELWTRLRNICENGGSVLVFTTDMDEAFAEGDEVAVMAEGKLGPFLPAADADRREYAAMMVNGW